jgi:hypothetical protein
VPARPSHYAARFVASVAGRGPTPEEREWARSLLEPAERDLFDKLGRADAREAIDTARRADALFAAEGRDAEPRWLAAALLHDVGKLDARLGPVRRALATTLGFAGARRLSYSWREAGGIRRRIALYLLHPQIGADRLKLVGAREEAIRWARVHHSPQLWREYGIPPGVGAVLAAADGEIPPSD